MSMNEKNRHVSVPQPLPANYGPPVPPVGPGPGQGVGQQPWMPNTVHPSSYMAHPGYSSTYKNNGNTPVRAPGYLPPMHHGGYIPRYPPFDTQCQSFPYGKVHEGPARPLNPSSYTITKHFNSQSPYTDPSKDVAAPKNLETFSQSKSPHPTKEKNSQIHEKNGREDMLSSPSEGKSDSETNLTTTESCPDDTRSPTSCDKQENFDKTENSIKTSNDSNSHSIEPASKKCKNSDINNSDTNSEQDSQCFSSILNSNNQVKKDNSGMHPSYEMRIHNPPFSHSDNMYGMYPDGDRRMHNNLSHNPNIPSLNPHINDSIHFGYHSLSHSNMSDVDKLSDLDFSEKSNTSENVFQVPSISSTTPPKIFPPIPPSPMSESWGEETKYYAPQDEMDTEKVPRKKRKRCGECPGCLQKQNCGRCGPCRSVRSHQICKMRKCESLKTKKEKAAEESMKMGRKGPRGGGGVDLVSESSRGASDVGVKVNGAASYMPDNTGQHLGPQSMRNYVDQYHPQGGSSYQPPAMLNSYNSPNPQYGSSFIPQVPPPPPHHPSVFESRTSVDGMMEVDAPNSTHRMTNSRLKTLIHNRQNQRGGGGEHGQQLMPICNPPPPHHHEPSFSYGSQQQYHHLPPANHGLQQQNSMLFNSAENSSLMHLQQLSPGSVERPHAAALSWSESSSNVPVKQPLVESSPPAAQQVAPTKPPPSQNGLTTTDSAEETTTTNNTTNTTTKAAMNGTEQQPAAESSSSTNCALEQQQQPPSSSERVEAPNTEAESEKSSNKIPIATATSSCDNHVMMTPPPPRYTTPGFLTPPGHAYRPPPNCLPPTNGVPNDTNCEESTQSPPFLLNTTTSMNTYINITSTYNSKLSFSNATCLPTFASTRVKNSSPTYSTGQYLYHLDSNNNSTYSLPKGGGTAMSCIDSGRIQDTFNNIVPPDTGHQQGLPLPDFCYDRTPTQQLDRIEKIRNNTKLEPPQCDCFKNKEVLPSEKVPYYTHLGSGSSVSAIRELVEYRSGEKGNAIRIEKLLYSGKEGKTSQGCPLAKWIIRRSGPEEKFLTVIRHRPGHTCTTAYIIIALVAWEGISQSVADMLYQTVVYKTVNFGIPTQRKCGTNEMRTCACQGLDPETCGASFSFGCSWSMYYNGCKFARSKNARKFKLTEKDEEKELEDKLQNLATDVAQLYERMAPDSFQNQTEFEHQASDCRLGLQKGRPFSGVTACIDYCAHSHKDLQNMNNGCTVVVTLTKHRGWTKPEDEQLHVLPLYVMDNTDEYGSKEGQEKKIASGSLEVLTKYPVNFRVRTTPLKPCKTRGRKPKDGFSPRRLAVQNTFRQLIASGKLHRIDPPVNLLKSNIMTNCNFKFPESNALAHTREFPKCENNHHSDKTACKFYAGKHILSSCGKFPNMPDNPMCSQNSSTTCFDSCSSKSSYIGHGPTSCRNIYSSTEPPPSSLILSSSEECAYNNVSQSSLPHCAHPQFYSYCSDHNSDAYSYGSSYSNPYSNGETSNAAYTSSFHNPYLYQYATPNIPLKIPGNYCAASRFQHSSNAHYQMCNSNSPYPGQPFSNNYCHSVSSLSDMSNGSEKNVFLPLQSSCDSRFGSYQNYQKGGYNESSVNDTNGVFLENRDKQLDLNDVRMQNTNPEMESCGTDSRMTTSKKEDVVSAQNYNYHLQQSNLILDFDNISDIYSTHSGSSAAAKEGLQNDDDKYRQVCPVDEESPMHGDEIYEGESDNEASFRDVEVGGVAIALTHGSVLFECAKHELHATTALKKPNRTNPTRISLVFYQHKHLNYRNHGEAEWGQKVKDKQQSFDDHAKKTRLQDPDDTPMRRLVATTPTTSWVTVVSIAPYPVGQ